MLDNLLDVGWTDDLSPSQYRKEYEDYVARGWHGDMAYLDRTKESRLKPKQYVPWAVGALVFLESYAQPLVEEDEEAFQVAAYARLKLDYHDFLQEKATSLVDTYFSSLAQTKVCVDAAPVAERELAVRAGLGFIGKNGLLLHPRFGSQFFIGVIFSSEAPTRVVYRLKEENVQHCGSCTACLDACPTQAFEEAYRLNPQKCLSYWTIESKQEEIPEPIRSKQGKWLFGCDDCQDVCPWNRFARATKEDVDVARVNVRREKLLDQLNDSSHFFGFRGKSPLRRLSHAKWTRNISHLLGKRVR